MLGGTDHTRLNHAVKRLLCFEKLLSVNWGKLRSYNIPVNFLHFDGDSTMQLHVERHVGALPIALPAFFPATPFHTGNEG